MKLKYFYIHTVKKNFFWNNRGVVDKNKILTLILKSPNIFPHRWISYVHIWAHISYVGEGHGNLLQYSGLENPVDRGAWWAAVHGVAHSWTWLKWLSIHACIGEGNSNALQYSCLENPRDGRAWWAAVCEFAQSWTRLKQLSSSISCVTIAA